VQTFDTITLARSNAFLVAFLPRTKTRYFSPPGTFIWGLGSTAGTHPPNKSYSGYYEVLPKI